MAFRTFMYRGAKIHLDGNPLDVIEEIHQAWLHLQNLKLSQPDLAVKIRDRAGRSLVRSYHGQDDIFLAHVPVIPVEEEVGLEKIVYTPMLYPAIIVWSEVTPTELEQVGFITSHVPGTLEPPFRFWPIADITQLHHWKQGQWIKATGAWKTQMEDWGGGIGVSNPGNDKWIPTALDPITSTLCREITPLCTNTMREPDYALINPGQEGDYAPYPEGTSDADRAPKWVGDYEIILIANPDLYYWLGWKPARHHGGWVYNTGVTLGDKITQIWTPMQGAGCPGNGAAQGWARVGVPTTAGWFTGHLGAPWAQRFSFIEVDFMACNRTNFGNVGQYNAAKAAEAALDDWQRVFPTCDPGECVQTVPAWNKVGWWNELDDPADPGFGWPWLKVERVGTTMSALGGFTNAGHWIWFQEAATVYTTQGGRQPWGGAYFYQYGVKYNRDDYLREYLGEVPNWASFPFHLTSITKD
jgi:hypothetical protein